MDANTIQSRIEAGISDARVKAHLDGNKCHVVVVSDAFADVRAVKKQQMVYGCLNDLISSGELHAVTMETLSIAEYNEKCKFGDPLV